jgi:hypothetical protein
LAEGGAVQIEFANPKRGNQFMNAQEAIKQVIQMGDMVAMSYLADLSDADLMRRPHSGCNHINWQIGHLIVSENYLVNQAVPGSMPELPPGFADRYTPETSGSDDPAAFAGKEQLLDVYRQQRSGTLAALAGTTAEELDRATGIDYAPNVGAIFSLQGTHWLMHSGQWVVVRRELGRPPLF